MAIIAKTLRPLPPPLLGLVLCLLAALLPAACRRHGEPRWPTDGSLVVALTNAPLNLDPRVATDQASARVFQLILNGLVTKDPRGNLIPDLAERWEVLEGGRRYRFHLRPGVTFHDGRPLTADDVAWTFNTILDGTVQTAKRGAYEVVEAVEVVDERTVDFALKEPFGALLADLTPDQGILPAGTGEAEMNAHPIGTGPFRFAGRTPETVTLLPNPSYWEGPPRLSRVVLKEVPDTTVQVLELLKGTVQLVINDVPPDVVPRFRRDPNFQVVESPGATYAYLGLNLEDPILADRRVRRALALALDRQRLVDTLWRGLGVVTETLLPPGLWARHEGLEPIPHDVAAARRLLDEAGYPDPDGPEGPAPRLTLTYKTSTNEQALLQAQILQAMAAEAGIHLEVRSHEFATFYNDVKNGNFQIFSLFRTGIIEPHIYNLVLHSRNLPPAGQNRGRYRDPEFDRIIDQAAALTDPAERRPLYLRAQEIFARDLPYISLFIRVNYAVLPTPLEGYENYPSGELFSLKKARWAR